MTRALPQERQERRNMDTEGYPIPTTEAEFQRDERAAIVEFDGSPAQSVIDVFQGAVQIEGF